MSFHWLNELSIKHRYLVYGSAWLCMMLIQATCTPIHSDEAYYWMYAQQPDIGYFDHPPMVAAFIWLSGWLAPGFLGVRLVSVLTQSLAFWVLWRMIPDHNRLNINVFWCFILLLPLLQIYGFITTPDAPLFLMLSVFLWSYKRLLERNNWLDHIVCGLAMGLMLYAKYHGILVIFFIVLSNPRLLLNPRFYLAAVVGIGVFLPHIWWQYTHDWVSFRFHLDERRGESLWYHQLEFLGNVLLILNPFLILFAYRLVRIRTKDLFERGLLFVFFGMIVFFMWQTLRDHVQPQWLFAIYLPFILLLTPRTTEQQFGYLKKVAIYSIPLFLFLHLALAFDLVSDHLGIHRKQETMTEVKRQAGQLPVLFVNSYQNAGLYGFYQDMPGINSLNTATGRKSQFNLWMHDTLLHNRMVYVVGDQFTQLPLKEQNGGIWAQALPFKCYEHLDLRILDAKTDQDSFRLNIAITNPYPFPIELTQDSVGVELFYFEGKKMAKEGKKVLILQDKTLQPNETFAMRTLAYPLGNEQTTHFGIGPFRSFYPSASLKKWRLEAGD